MWQSIKKIASPPTADRNDRRDKIKNLPQVKYINFAPEISKISIS